MPKPTRACAPDTVETATFFLCAQTPYDLNGLYLGRWTWRSVLKLLGIIVVCWLLCFAGMELLSRIGRSPHSPKTNLLVPTVISALVLVSVLCLYWRKSAAVVDDAPQDQSLFTGAGRSLGTEVWRIEHFTPVKVPDADKGRFSKGMCTPLTLWELRLSCGHRLCPEELEGFVTGILAIVVNSHPCKYMIDMHDPV